MMLKKRLLKRIVLSFILVGVGFFGYRWYIGSSRQSYMADFDYKRDASFILDIFKNNWYWLIAEGSDFSPEYMLKHKASSRAPEHMGNETIKVMYVDGKPVGFVTYYSLKFYEARIHFVAVDQSCRSRGYGLALVRYALNELTKQGYKKISLVTRVNNYSAQAIYKKAGFKESHINNGFIYFNYYPTL